MKFVYETPVAALILRLDAEDVLTASGFVLADCGEGDHIGIAPLRTPPPTPQPPLAKAL